MANILVVDDELGIRSLLCEILNDEGHTVEVAENAAQARAARPAHPRLIWGVAPAWACSASLKTRIAPRPYGTAGPPLF